VLDINAMHLKAAARLLVFTVLWTSVASLISSDLADMNNRLHGLRGVDVINATFQETYIDYVSKSNDVSFLYYRPEIKEVGDLVSNLASLWTS